MLSARLKSALEAHHRAPPQPRSDFDLNPGKAYLDVAALRPAAVLVPIVERAEGAQVLLTRRAASLRKHAGQVSFPGGRIDPGDRDAVAAALRETAEETAITSDHIQVLGTLSPYRTVTQFDITPVVGLLAPNFSAHPEPDEVAEIFEVPLDFILNRDNHVRESAEWRGETRHYYAMPYRNYYIWGATAAMLVNLVDVLEPALADT